MISIVCHAFLAGFEVVRAVCVCFCRFSTGWSGWSGCHIQRVEAKSERQQACTQTIIPRWDLQHWGVAGSGLLRGAVSWPRAYPEISAHPYEHRKSTRICFPYKQCLFRFASWHSRCYSHLGIWLGKASTHARLENCQDKLLQVTALLDHSLLYLICHMKWKLDRLELCLSVTSGSWRSGPVGSGFCRTVTQWLCSSQNDSLHFSSSGPSVFLTALERLKILSCSWRRFWPDGLMCTSVGKTGLAGNSLCIHFDLETIFIYPCNSFSSSQWSGSTQVSKYCLNHYILQ